MTPAWHSNWKHLRVPFQLTLAPLFLWGALHSGSPAGPRVALGFFVFHFLLYTGITAYNSCCDRDEGPIGGLERPPGVSPTLQPLALLLKAVGALLAPFCGAAFAAIYLVFVALSFLYSHPRTRWKASPLFSTLVVFGGQGILGFYAGWAAAKGSLHGWETLPATLGAMSAGFTTLGMYPLTQIYQIEEDARRGDRTLCVCLGPRRAVRLSQAAFLAAGIAAATLCRLRFGVADAVVIGTAYGAILLALEGFHARFEAMDPRRAFRSVMWILYGCSAAFAGFIALEYLR
jgi:4-hydroxybenzoate polyprenyltransferase